MRALQAGGSAFEKIDGAGQEPLPARAAHHVEPLHDPVLQGRAEALAPSDDVAGAGVLQLGEGADAERLVEPQDLLGAEAGNPEHRQDARRRLPAQLFQGRMRAGLVQRRDALGEPGTDAGNVAQPAPRDHLIEGHRQGAQGIGRPVVGACAIRVLAGELDALPELDEELCDRGDVKARVHIRHALLTPGQAAEVRRHSAAAVLKAFPPGDRTLSAAGALDKVSGGRR